MGRIVSVRRIFAFLFISLIFTAAILAQDAPFTLKVDVASISLDVAVFDASGKPISDLRKADFQIYEDGRPQQIQSFASSMSPYNVLLIIDTSASMQDQVKFVSEAINRFFSNLRSQDKVALAAFDNNIHRLLDWRSVQTGPNKMVRLESGGNTDFYGALEWAARELGKVKGRKTALIFTDGADNRIHDAWPNAVAFRKALNAVRRSRVPFHFVGLDADPELGGAQIKRLAEDTGGQAYFPKTIEEVVPLYDQISRDLGISYTLVYSSDQHVRDGNYRKIQVVVAGKQYRVSQSRAGYTAAGK
jgi:VWFA-related protein